MFLAKVLISRKDERTKLVPVGAIPALLSGLTLLMVLPSGIDVLRAVARTVNGSVTTPMLAACAWYARWHSFSLVSEPAGAGSLESFEHRVDLLPVL